MCIPIDICDPKNNYNKIIYSFINYNCYLIFHMWVRLEHVTSSRFKYSRK